jgi:hypothetical protein
MGGAIPKQAVGVVFVKPRSDAAGGRRSWRREDRDDGLQFCNVFLSKALPLAGTAFLDSSTPQPGYSCR